MTDEQIHTLAADLVFALPEIQSEASIQAQNWQSDEAGVACATETIEKIIQVHCEGDWKSRLRDFASDNEQHTITHRQWKADRGNGVTLYCFGGFFTAYFDDAAELWGQADDTLPMYHVMASVTPHRTVIHPLHLVSWVEHLAEICLPVQIMKGEFDE